MALPPPDETRRPSDDRTLAEHLNGDSSTSFRELRGIIFGAIFALALPVALAILTVYLCLRSGFGTPTQVVLLTSFAFLSGMFLMNAFVIGPLALLAKPIHRKARKGTPERALLRELARQARDATPTANHPTPSERAAGETADASPESPSATPTDRE